MLDKNFDPAEAEPRIARAWEQAHRFACGGAAAGAPFTLMMPPPNVTGSLHTGHALSYTLQDVLIRYRRMTGRDSLWQPGTDHAGIATQMVVERLLEAEGTRRENLGREAFVKRVWAWKERSGGAITGQLRRLGASADWSRERFTLDEGMSRAVRRVFVDLFRQGLIYRDRRLVNWDPKLQTAISDLEVESRESEGFLWHLRYPLADDPERCLTVATTRPETLLGDAAVAVHPDDPRYRDLIGGAVILPLVGRRIPIIADDYADPEKGSGAVKITPAHDFNDFAVGRRHGLPMPSVLDRAGRVTLADIESALGENALEGQADFVRGLAGLDRAAARAAILVELGRLGVLEKAEPHRNQVPYGDRSGVVIEPLLTTQWFCDAGRMALPAIRAVETGATRFVPKQWENSFFAWMRAIEPWCISRQLWWGHRIPAWYGPDGAVFVAEELGQAEAAAASHYGEKTILTQDADVLDTWFSSALWPFSTLGWPEPSAVLDQHYPGDVLVTGFDIVFFWVARMMMMGLHCMGEVPFRTVYIHGLVRDERGQKMSKSKGNVIDPLALIDQYGTDALRFTIAALAGPGRDIKLGAARVEAYRAFVTKLWNAARFAEINAVRSDPRFAPEHAQAPLCRWILAECAAAAAEAGDALEAFRFDDYAAACYRFTWNVFCDWFLELAKPALAEGESSGEVRAVTAHVLGVILRLLHPAMPFVTEALWASFGFGAEGSLCVAAWPQTFEVPGAAAAQAELGWLLRFIGAIRTVRAEMNVPPSQLGAVLLQDASAQTQARAERWREPIRRLARVSSVALHAGEVPPQSVQLGVDEATVILPLAGLIDIDAERARLIRERDKADAEADKVRRRLEDPTFVARAKAAVVEENRARLAGFEREGGRLREAIERIE